MYVFMFIASFIMNMTFLIDSFDFNAHNQHVVHLGRVAGEVAAASVQFVEENDYAEGVKVFKYEQGIMQANAMLATNLNADIDSVQGNWDYDSRTYTAIIEPLANNYIKDTIKYTIIFFDDSNTSYPVLYQNGTFIHAIGDPTAVVIIDTGKPRYRSIFAPKSTKLGAAQTWQAR
jgi:hypothetical protein